MFAEKFVPRKQITILLLLFAFSVDGKWFDSLNNLKSKVSNDTQVQAVYDLLKRLIPGNQKNQFVLIVDPLLNNENETVVIDKGKSANSIQIVGTSGVAVAFGIHSYLKNCCNIHISWDGNQLSLPDVLPQPKDRLLLQSVGWFRYYSNVCTFGYSFVWWNWTQWEVHLDWMALNGINLPLASIGQEIIWRQVFMKLGLSKQNVDNFFTGPAFLAWHRMGNLKEWAGPLSDSWHKSRLKLQQKILSRMLSLGMTPVLPAFAGHVPDEMKKLFPNASITALSAWTNFNCTYSCVHFVEPTDPLFRKIGSEFMTEMKNVFGLYHAYSADPFNEMVPKTFEPSYIKSVGKSIYDGMAVVDPHAIWVMQAWMFVGTVEWRSENVSQALATSVPMGKLLFLDLYAEEYPIYPMVKSYHGQPFIWCMLHNFGGKLGMYGMVEKLNKGFYEAVHYANSTLVGAGLTMEGINQNYPIYSMALDLFWSNDGFPMNPTKWIEDMSVKRYGKKDAAISSAWNLLWTTVYNYTGDTVECSETNNEPEYYYHRRLHSLHKFKLNCHLVKHKKLPQNMKRAKSIVKYDTSLLLFRPRLDLKRQLWFDPRIVCLAWKYFVHESEQFQNSSLFRRDLVDLTRESLNIIAGFYYQIMVDAYRSNQTNRLHTFGDKLLQILTDIDLILQSDQHFLLGSWVEKAKSWANSDAERVQMEFNAKNQITLWGPNGEIADYARKQWAGMMEDFYKPRWSMFIASLLESLTTGMAFNQRKFEREIFLLSEKPFGEARTVYPDTPIGDSAKISKQLYKDYSNDCKSIKWHE